MAIFNNDIFHSLFQFIPERNVSDSQKNIALMYALGMNADEIADQIKIKPRTVRWHLDAVRMAFGEVRMAHVKTIIFMRIITAYILISSNNQ